MFSSWIEFSLSTISISKAGPWVILQIKLSETITVRVSPCLPKTFDMSTIYHQYLIGPFGIRSKVNLNCATNSPIRKYKCNKSRSCSVLFCDHISKVRTKYTKSGAFAIPSFSQRTLYGSSRPCFTHSTTPNLACFSSSNALENSLYLLNIFESK